LWGDNSLNNLVTYVDNYTYADNYTSEMQVCYRAYPSVITTDINPVLEWTNTSSSITDHTNYTWILSPNYDNLVTTSWDAQGWINRTRRSLDPDVRNRERERKVAWRRAQSRARKLFIDLFGMEPFRTLLEKGHLIIKGPSGKMYKLSPGRMMEVCESGKEFKTEYKLCVHHQYGIPDFDTLITQILQIRSGEEGERQLVQIANKYEIARYAA